MAVLFTDTCLLMSHPFVPPFAMASSSLLAVTFSAVVVVTVVCSRYVFMFCGPSRGPHHSRAGDAHKILELRDSLKGGPAEFGILENDIPEFVHLSKAHFFIPGGGKVPYDDDGVFWRCRLSEVCGFHFGLLGLSDT